MNVVRFQSPVYGVNNLVDEMLRDCSKPVAKNVKRVPLNVFENEQGYFLELSVPGYSKEQFKVSSKDDKLTIKADVEEKEETNYKRREFSVTAFEKSYYLPDNVDLDNISAKYNNGILTVELKKLEKEEKNIEINVQ